MKALVRLIKCLIITAVAFVVLAVAGYYGEALYSDAQANKALTQQTSHSDWQWQKDRGLGNRRSSDVQWHISEDGLYGLKLKDNGDYLMRRVYENRSVVAVLRQGEDGKAYLHARTDWLADCQEGTFIETNGTYSNGKPYVLRCLKSDSGHRLSTSVTWPSVDLDDLPLWSDNFDGFAVNEDFDSYAWNFQPAVRHLTLQNAKPVEELIAAIRAERAAKKLRMAEEAEQ